MESGDVGGLMKQLMKEFEFSEPLVEAASVMQPHWAQSNSYI